MSEISKMPATLKLLGDGQVPNNQHLPVLHYPAVLTSDDGDMASAFERMFDQHQWPAAWRSGILGFHHFHCDAHEALGVYSGVLQLRLGGESGQDIVLRAGDVAVLPAGVAHKQLSCEGTAGVVGAYPQGQSADMCRPDEARYAARVSQVAAVSLPLADPVFGADGPLMSFWHNSSVMAGE